MWTDVLDLRDFYDRNPGRVARRLIRQSVRTIWPDVKGESLLGLGYATPYLRQFRQEAARIVAVMPAAQGVLHWPPEGPNVVTLSDESELPLPDLSMDRVLLVHAIEHSEQLRRMLREVWRVMAGGGRLLVVAPNRRGVWARFERTPFGHGRPYSESQLSRLLRENMFMPIQTDAALFVPPLRSSMLLGSAAALEKAGRRWFQAIGGVVLIEAGKQIYAGTAIPARPVKERVVVPIPKAPAGTMSGTRRARSVPPAD